MKVITVFNQLENSKKTQTCIGLARALANSNKHVLLIDMDDKQHLSKYFNLKEMNDKKTIYDILVGDAILSDGITCSESTYLDVITGSKLMANIDCHDITGMIDNLKQELNCILFNNYDYVIIDCPSSFSSPSTVALAVCDEVIVPVQCRIKALNGLTELMKYIRNVQQEYNASLKIAGLLATDHDGSEDANEVVKGLKLYFKDKVLEVMIPTHDNVDLLNHYYDIISKIL